MEQEISKRSNINSCMKSAAWEVFDFISQQLTKAPEEACCCCSLFPVLTEKIERLFAGGQHAQNIHRITGVSRYYVVKHLKYVQKNKGDEVITNKRKAS